MKCMKCGCMFSEGIFCPECGYKYDPDEVKAEEERLERERSERERLKRERQEREKVQEENARQEREQRLKEQKLEEQKLEEQKQQERTYNGVIYASKEEADFAKTAKDENDRIDLLKIKLEGTKSQADRQKIMEDFQDDIRTTEAKKRLELLRQKVNQPVPKAEKNNKFVGIISVLIFVLSVVACMLYEDNDNIIIAASFLMLGGMIGLLVWLIRKILISIRKKSKGYYLYIKDI